MKKLQFDFFSKVTLKESIKTGNSIDDLKLRKSVIVFFNKNEKNLLKQCKKDFISKEIAKLDGWDIESSITKCKTIEDGLRRIGTYRKYKDVYLKIWNDDYWEN